MIIDASVAFVPVGSPLSLVGATGASFYSNVVDLLGQGAGTAPANIIGNTSVFGADLGVGDDRLLLDVVVGTALATADSCTLTVAFQGAPDSGSAGGYQPGTWQTFLQSPAITAAQGATNTRIARFDWPPMFPETLAELPRYLRLGFLTPTGEQFTAGTILYAVPTPARDDWSAKFAARNYAVA